MRTKLFAALTSAALASAVGVMWIQAADAHRPPPGTRMLLTFDHREPLKRGTVVRDTSGHHHGGRVLTRHGGSLRPVRGWFKRGVAFPRLCDPGCGRAIIQVADHKGLDPQRRAFVFGAAVKVSRHQASVASNVVQKGYFNQAGGQYKLQLLAGGRPSCVVFGGRGRLIIKARRSVANDKWHRLSCTRTAERVTLRIDGKVSATDRGATGFIGNAAPIRVGGKKITPQNKQYHGALDGVFVRFL